ncbi:hypothetical protein [Kosakonia sacchari]|nr:hypothetical protein [Kosakonia sacchari]MDN2484635.1 hypothetical protein [Kosakonia sacchari]
MNLPDAGICQKPGVRVSRMAKKVVLSTGRFVPSTNGVIKGKALVAIPSI